MVSSVRENVDHRGILLRADVRYDKLSAFSDIRPAKSRDRLGPGRHHRAVVFRPVRGRSVGLPVERVYRKRLRALGDHQGVGQSSVLTVKADHRARVRFSPGGNYLRIFPGHFLGDGPAYAIYGDEPFPQRGRLGPVAAKVFLHQLQTHLRALGKAREDNTASAVFAVEIPTERGGNVSVGRLKRGGAPLLRELVRVHGHLTVVRRKQSSRILIYALFHIESVDEL